MKGNKMRANFLLQREIQNELVCQKAISPSFVLHFHSHIEIYIVLSGEIEIIVNDQKRVLGAGEISVAFSYDAHGYRTVKPSEAIYLIIPTSLCGEFLPLLSSKNYGSSFISDEKTFSAAKSAAEGLMESKNELSKRGFVYVILGALIDALPKKEQNQAATHSFAPEMLIYIGNHSREELTLGDVAKAFGYHPSYLSRSFRETFGISFVKYLNMIRLRDAMLLLRTEKMNVTQCALESGFGSMRSFYRAFHDEFGCTPKEYLEKEKSK